MITSSAVNSANAAVAEKDRWPGTARKIVWAVVIFDVLMLVLSVGSDPFTARYAVVYGSSLSHWLSYLGDVVQISLGALIAIRRPRHAVGWLLLGAATVGQLAVALEAQARKATLPVEVDADGIERYPQDIEAAVYFCVLEALQNVQKYASAKQARVRLWAEDDEVMFEVHDDGNGFDPSTQNKGSGLTNMEDRLDALGGGVEVVCRRRAPAPNS